MDLGLKGKVALVTGASGGIGEAIAMDLAREGVNLSLCYRSRGCDGLLSEIRELGNEVVAFQADLSMSDEVRGLARRTFETYGRIDILVNNAGTGLRGPVEGMREEDWDRIMAVNLKSVFLLSQAVVQYMKKNRWGRIINIGSGVAKTGTNAQPWIDPGTSNLSSGAAYVASKAGVHALTKTLAKEVAAFGITVNCVAPGPIKTPMISAFPDFIKNQVPLLRLGSPKEVSAFVVMLASENAGYVTGEIVDVNGGLWMD
jgi:3-oxoacyl-[acyl-carrier protein] reductase